MDPLYIYLTYYFRTTDIEYFTDPINSAYFKLIVNSTDVSNFYNFYIRDMAMWDKNGDYWTFFENISFDEAENMYIDLNKPYTKIIKRKVGPNKQYTIQFHSYNCKTCCKYTVNWSPTSTRIKSLYPITLKRCWSDNFPTYLAETTSPELGFLIESKLYILSSFLSKFFLKPFFE